MRAFDNLYRHGFARAAICAPRIQLGDPEANAREMIHLLKAAHEAHAVLCLGPELGLCGYTLDDLLLQSTLLSAVERAIRLCVEASRSHAPLLIIGAPVRHRDSLYNCAIIIHRGVILGVVPKTYLPNYREFYEKRYFASAPIGEGQAHCADIVLAGQSCKFGSHLLFEAEDIADLVIGVEICEDLWAPISPSTFAALHGASVLCNLSASNITIGKSQLRNQLCGAQSDRCVAAYLYSAAGRGESTNDLAWDGHLTAFELGRQLGESTRFASDSQILFVDIDLERIAQERMRMATFRDCADHHLVQPSQYCRVKFFAGMSRENPIPLRRDIARFPFVPEDPAQLDQDCFEAYNIQVHSLWQRLEAANASKAVIGVSGGLDSTQALLVIARAFDLMKRPRADIIGVTLPGFATGDVSKSHAWTMMRALGIDAREVDIRPLASQMLSDLDHPFAKGEAAYDVTFENVQAGLRTDYLFRLANHENGLVIGTGDLSEIALGWCTYGVGDHMSHYNVNAGLPKTLIQHLIRWVAGQALWDEDTRRTLNEIVEAAITPELVPVAADGAVQSTEAKIGPYELQDFNLYYATRYGLSPQKIAFLAMSAWSDAKRGQWPKNLGVEKRKQYELAEILDWLDIFVRRFYGFSQFKRTCMPNGPKLSSGGALSPRGDWRAPSDASAEPWLAELRALRQELEQAAKAL